METEEPMPGPGRFQWNQGAWIGGQVSGTAWMLVGAVVLAPHAPEVAGVWLACFAVANAIGSWLWWRRGRLRPYPAGQAMLSACGVNGLIALIALHVLRPGLSVTRPQGIRLTDEPQVIPRFLVLIIALMTCLHLMERSAEKERSRAGGSPGHPAAGTRRAGR